MLKYLANSANALKYLVNHPKAKIDHVAYRNFNDSYLQIINYNNSYKLMDDIYTFPKYGTRARWFKCINNVKPRIFFSYHENVYGSNDLNQDQRKMILSNKLLTFNEYIDLYKVNQYIAWTYLFKTDINHIAIQVNDIQKTTENLIESGIKFNTDGGLYKVSKDGLLIQSATMANMIKVNFADKADYVPYTFLEFVERKKDSNGNERDGFETENATKIFTSTKF